MAEVRDPWSAPAALNIYTGDHTGARIPLDSGRAREGTKTCPATSWKEASYLACWPASAMMMLCDPGLVSGPLCSHHFTEQVYPHLLSNFTPGLRSGPHQAGV